MVFHFEFVLFLVQNYLDILTTEYEMGNCEKLHLKNHCKIMNGLMATDACSKEVCFRFPRPVFRYHI